MIGLAKDIHDAIVNADCYCTPGDPTCADWTSAAHRWAAIHAAVMKTIDNFFEANGSESLETIPYISHDEQIRIEALTVTTGKLSGMFNPTDNVIKMASKFEDYIKNGYTAPEQQPSNLVLHARRELELVGEDILTINGLCRVIQAFADMGHSGGSASVAIPMINELLQFKNLTPLTDDPNEWVDQSEYTPGNPMWQSNRNPEAFSQDGGKTYYLLSEGGHMNNPTPLHNSVHKEQKDNIVPIGDNVDVIRSLSEGEVNGTDET